MGFGIHSSSWLDSPGPAEAIEAVKAKAQWAENHGFVRFSVMDNMIQIPRVGAPDEPILAGWTVLAGLAAVTDILPAMNKPAISALTDDGWVDLMVIVGERQARDLIPGLRRHCAEDIVEFPLTKGDPVTPHSAGNTGPFRPGRPRSRN
jgi:hypothetical protein